ncbi:MAG: polysaccharide biosynthesis tyrosine autokinase [Chloroflexi bacterium]|nr:polysaccharide biosynthesis tyrosine autokinase [Chloroflexota bacterium]
MELSYYIAPLKKWWKLLVAAALVAAVSSLLATLPQPNIYEAKTTLIIGRTLSDPNPNANQIITDRQMAAIYADLVTRETIQNATMDALGIDWLPKYEAVAVPNSQLIEITVVDNIPERAQAVANELAAQLIKNSPGSSEAMSPERVSFINSQLDSYQEQIQVTQGEIDRLQAELGEQTSAIQIQDTQNSIAALENKIATLRDNYATLLASAPQGASNIITVLAPAELPTYPIGPNRILIVLVAAFSGFAFASGAAYFIEFSSNKVSSTSEVEHLLQMPILAKIPEIKTESKWDHLKEFPFSPVAESFRSLRTNIELTSIDQPVHTIMVSSPGTSEGKSTIAINLAVAIAQSEKKVVIVGADLRKPVLQEMLGLEGKKGLSDLLRKEVTLEEVMYPIQENTLWVIPAGTLPPNPTEVLGSKTFGQFLNSLHDMVDIVILDGAPFIVADATVLAAQVDGVLLVIRPDYTKKDAMISMRDQINRTGCQALGVVLNFTENHNSYDSAYYYVYEQDPGTSKNGNKKPDEKDINTILDKVRGFFNN